MVWREEIEDLLGELNAKSKGTYKIIGAYGKFQIVAMRKEGGVVNISPFLSRGEMKYTLLTIVNYLRNEERERKKLFEST